MKEFLEKINGEAQTLVNDTNIASTVKSGSLPVFSTPSLLALVEEASCNAIESYLEFDETSVGTHMDIKHIAASEMGRIITAKAELKEANGIKLSFEVNAYDDFGTLVGTGTVKRVVVSSEKFMERLER